MKKEIILCWSIILLIVLIGSVIVLKNLIIINNNNQEAMQNHTKISDRFNHIDAIEQINLSSMKSIKTIIITFIIGFIATILITIFIFNTLHKRINFLLAGVNQISIGNLDYVIPLISNDEFGFLTNSFNQMSKTLKEKNILIETNNINLEKMNLELTELSKNLEEKILARTEELESIMQNMGDGLFTVNIEQKIMYFNNSAEKITGYKKEEVLNKTCYEALQCPNCKPNCGFLLSPHMTTDDCRIIKETSIQNKNGDTIYVIKDAIILKDKNNKNIGAVEILRDITEAKKIEQMKNDFISMITHDLKSPLTSILGFSILCLRNPEINENASLKNALKRIQTSGNKMLTLINDFLTVTQIENGKIELNLSKINVQKILIEVIEDLKTNALEQKISINFSYLKNIPDIIGDEIQIERIFHNIISNAIKYSPTGLNRDIFIEIHQTLNFLDISIQDQGIGISKEETIEIFNKYRRSAGVKKIKGTGLGLFIVKNLMDSLNGNISINSKIGEGTKVTLSFPI